MKAIRITLIILPLSLGVFGQETEKKRKATFATKIVHNSVAGFAPFFFANFKTKKSFDISLYSIFWTNTSFGNPAGGSDLLLETGVGLWFPLMDNALVLNPGIGFGHGKFSSNVTGTRIAESIIPNMYARFDKGFFDFEGYIAYYKFLRGDEATSKDFLLNWAAPGVKIGQRVVAGVFYESFGIVRQSDNENPPNIYTWLGGSVKLKLDKGIAFRFSAGPTLNTDVGTSDEFYKVSAFIPF